MNWHVFFCLAALIPAMCTLSAAVTLPSIFSDHAVLAKKSVVPVWGKADPGEKITVKFNGQTRTATTGNDGKFRVDLDLSKSPAGPFTLQVNDKIIKDVLVGEVFLASGQSNMNFRLAKCENIQSLQKDQQLRFFCVTRNYSFKPTADAAGKWIMFSPQKLNEFSGVAYFFAAELRRILQSPVGIIQSSVGGTMIEAWMSEESLKPFPNASKAGRESLAEFKGYPAKYKKFLRDNTAWEKKYRRSDIPHIAPAADAQWTAVPKRIPGSGIVWLKNTFNITAEQAKKGFIISFDKVFVPMTVWIDGKKVGSRVENAWEIASYQCPIKGGTLAPGKHTIMLRFHASRSPINLRFPAIRKKVISSGWQMYREKRFPTLSGDGRKECPATPGQPLNPWRKLNSVLYNAMIQPLEPYALSGIIWYQGESNAMRAWEYAQLFPAMITNWREKFEDKDLQFFFCLLAPYRPKNSDPAEFGWGDLRAAQLRALKLKNTGMAVIFDAGETGDIHPLDKTTVGKRLAAQALNKMYGKDIPCESPRATHAVKKAGKVTIYFEHTYGVLTAREVPTIQHVKKAAGTTAPLVRTSPDTQLEGFILCDSNGKWFWANKAEISGSNTVTVSSAKVQNPVKVRYCWSNNPTCNLFNNAGFPAAPFELILQ